MMSTTVSGGAKTAVGAAAEESSGASAAPEGNPPGRARYARRWWAMLLLGGAAFLIVLDTSMVVTALPAIQADLSFSTAALQWVVTAYMLTFGGFMLLGGRLADLLGRRRVFLTGAALYLLTSLLAGWAWSPEVLVAARAVQGLSAALAVPAALSIVLTLFPDGEERNKAVGVWGSISGLGSIAGFILGGPLTDGPGWAWIYFMNVPFAAAILVAGPLMLPESRDRSLVRRFDVAGAVTATGALTALVYAFSEVPEVGWAHPRTLALLVAALLLGTGFVLVELRAKAPLVPLRLFRSRMLVGGNAVLVASGLGMGFFVLVSLYSQQVLGYSARSFGWAMMAMMVPTVVGAIGTPSVVSRYGPRPVVVTGSLLMVSGALWLARAPDDASYWVNIFGPFVLIGFGFAAVLVAASIAALSGVADDDAGVASGVEETSSIVGGPVGVALLTTIAVSRTDWLLERGDHLVAAQAGGFRYAFVATAVFALVPMLLGLVLLRRVRQDGSPAPQAEVEYSVPVKDR